ncbi:protein kinase [Streptomyces sp. GMY01]|uniref:serine/threonine-protein kinase n=1 Tax=Streptomyces sp. GMY02 TaxID=1333528 RepID=UPI00146A60B1|nr:serine/threonine-protein kinase [Streptomyces sp. GMY02]NMO36330.1 protein kinase [Streptomyces sp. GMY02]
MGEVFAGRYELADPIGRGGVGAVWRAWDHRRRRYVAAKVLQQRDAHSLLRFVREQALRIDHPHVLAPASWAADDDKVLFTMDLVAGGSLVHLVGDYGPLPPAFVCTLLDQLLSGLAAVHAEGVVHRDIKPANVLLEATGTGRPRLRLSDFGIAMRLGEPRLTETNLVVGTPGYLAPEQLMGAEPDFPADLFATGLVALYLLQGAKPDAKALVEYFSEHGTPSAAKGVPEPLWQVVAMLLQPDPDARFRTATGARKALAAAAELLPEPGPDDELIEIFDQLGPLPPGFGPEGPLRRSPGVTVGTGREPRDDGTSDTTGAHGVTGDVGDSGDVGGSGDTGDAWDAGGGDGVGADTGGAFRGVPRAGSATGSVGAALPPAATGTPRGTDTYGGTNASYDDTDASYGGTDASYGGVGLPGGTGTGAYGTAGTHGRAGDSVGSGSDPRHGYRRDTGSTESFPDHVGHTPGARRPTAPPDTSGSTDATHPPNPPDSPYSTRSPHSTRSSDSTGSPRSAGSGGLPSSPDPSDTGSFHLPPPQTAFPQASHRPAAPRTAAPPAQAPTATPATRATGAPFGPVAQATAGRAHDPTHALRPPAPRPQADPATASYTAEDPRPPAAHPPAPARAASRHRAVRPRRPGPPAKAVVPLLLLALACYAVGFWALSRL